MTLDETIKEAKITSVVYENEARKCIQHSDLFHKEKAKAFRESAKEFEQIVEWLEELKAYREVYDTAGRPQGEWLEKGIYDNDDGEREMDAPFIVPSETESEEIQTQTIEFLDTHQEFVFTRKIEMCGDSIKIGDWEYKGVKMREKNE